MEQYVDLNVLAYAHVQAELHVQRVTERLLKVLGRVVNATQTWLLGMYPSCEDRKQVNCRPNREGRHTDIMRIHNEATTDNDE